ncbi:MAG TPA: nitroreductase family protein [Nitrospirota bacterium]|nr:nitroreductase family protein [Nitrospirota bacterium]
MYNDVKDHRSLGAFIQNMLLATHALGLGAVWLGEILKNADAVRLLLSLPENMELMAVVAIGHPASDKQSSKRNGLSEVLLKELLLIVDAPPLDPAIISFRRPHRPNSSTPYSCLCVLCMPR